jgi:hypothetical protein
LEYQGSGADTANSLADPNGFRYGAGASEGELTLPRASIAAFEVPEPANWHVHLELRPEELVALHRLGLTRGAIAWREGMEAWQPLRENQEPVGLGSEILGRASLPSSSDLEPTITSSSPSDWSDAVTVASERAPEPASQLAPAGEDDNSVILLSPRVRRATLPPTSPLFAAAARPHVMAVSPPITRSRNGAGGSSYPPPPSPVAQADSGVPLPFGGPAAPAMPGRLPPAPRMPSFASPDPALASFPVASAPPIAFEPTGVFPPKRRSLWFGAIGLAAVSALLGSAVSGIFSSNPDTATAEAPTERKAATAEATATAAAKPQNGLDPIPIDQLPVAGKAAPAAAAPAAAARDERNVEREAPSRPAREAVSRAAAEPRSEPAPREEPPPPHKQSALNDALAQAAGAAPPPAESESEPEADDEAPAPAKSSSDGPDLKAIATAVGTAARAATSCGASPQSGRVAITFSPSGAVRSVQMEQQYDERDVGACVLRAMGRAKVAAFTGDPVTVRKSVSW